MTIDTLSLDEKGCASQNFVIENCHAFTLRPGEQHWIHIGFKTDFTLAKTRKKITLESKQGVMQEFTFEVNMPVEVLSLANELTPLTWFEES